MTINNHYENFYNYDRKKERDNCATKRKNIKIKDYTLLLYIGLVAAGTGVASCNSTPALPLL